MKNAKIVLVAAWDGWCGACADDRPLVLTRTGRQLLRTWLTGAADDSRPLVLTCRLCGTGVDVPLEQDDPPIVVSTPEPQTVQAALAEGAEALHDEVVLAPPAVAAGVATIEELRTGRQVVAQALGGLLAQRSAAATVERAVPLPRPAPAPLAPLAVTPALPVQRIASRGGLAELQLLADGIDLLSSERA